MKTIEITGATRPLILYPPIPKIAKRIPVYTVPTKSKSGAGKVAFIPAYPDRFFRDTLRIDSGWLSERAKEIAAANLLPQILPADVNDHSQKDYELAAHFAQLANQKGQRINLEQLKTFAYAHDLGRMATGGKNPRFTETLPAVYHGVIGREIFIYFSERFRAVGNREAARLCRDLAKMCSAHTAGVGLTADSNRELGILPHGKSYFEDDLVWGPPLGSYPERVLVAVSDAKNFFVSTHFKYDGDSRIEKNGRALIKLSGGRVIIDRLLKKVILMTGTKPQTLAYRELSDWSPQDEIVLKFDAGGRSQRMVMEKGRLRLNERSNMPLAGYQLMAIGDGTIEIIELHIVSREAVHARFDHFHPRNRTNIDRAFDEVVRLVGEENRGRVDKGWFDPARIPG